MKTSANNELVTLTQEEIHCVAGSGGLPGGLPKAIDKNGKTVSMEEYMDRQLMAAKTGNANWIFDFDYTGFDRYDPNNW